MHSPVGKKKEKSWKIHRNRHSCGSSEVLLSPETVMHVLCHRREGLLPIRIIYGGFLSQM